MLANVRIARASNSNSRLNILGNLSMKKLLLLALLSLMMISVVSGADSVSCNKSVYVIPI